MNLSLVVSLVFLVLSVSSQTLEEKGVIDSFTLGTNILVFTITNANVHSLPNTLVSIYTDPANNPPGLLGGERDVSLTTQQGQTGQVISATVSGGQWVLAAPPFASGFVDLQLDGKDNSINLSPNGLNPNYDATANGATGFNLTTGSDTSSVCTITVYTPTGDCSVDLTIPSSTGQNPVFFFIPFSGANNTCNFQSIGAISMTIELLQNLDAIVTFFGTAGPIISPSASPTQTPGGTASNTPTPGGTASNSPSPAPNLCACRCPAFTCALAFDPDDDENSAYYFDDDDNAKRVASHNLKLLYNSATTLGLSLVTIIAALVFII